MKIEDFVNKVCIFCSKIEECAQWMDLEDTATFYEENETLKCIDFKKDV